MAISHELSAGSIELASMLAEAEAKRFEGCAGKYNGNDADKHFTGKLAEVGLSEMLEHVGLAVERKFMTELCSEDVTVHRPGQRPIRIEAKSNMRHNFAAHGRSLPPSQVSSVSARSDVIVWIAVDECGLRLTGNVPKIRYMVTIEGWNMPSDFKGASVHSYNGTDNLQLDQDQVRDVRSLLMLLCKPCR